MSSLETLDCLRLRVTVIYTKLFVYQTLLALLGIQFVLDFRHSPIFVALRDLPGCSVKLIPGRQNLGSFAGHKTFLIMRTSSSDYCSGFQVLWKGTY
jgi:hypothetical protein